MIEIVTVFVGIRPVKVLYHFLFFIFVCPMFQDSFSAPTPYMEEGREFMIESVWIIPGVLNIYFAVFRNQSADQELSGPDLESRIRNHVLKHSPRPSLNIQQIT